jgi:hypothetical protein
VLSNLSIKSSYRGTVFFFGTSNLVVRCFEERNLTAMILEGVTEIREDMVNVIRQREEKNECCNEESSVSHTDLGLGNRASRRESR